MTTTVESGPAVPTATPPAGPPGRRLLPWLGLLAAVLLAGLLVGALTSPPRRALDPAAAEPAGSKALVRVLEQYGVRVRATTSQADATSTSGGSVVVTDPDAYSDPQLRQLRSRAARVVLVRPSLRALHALLPDSDPTTSAGRGTPRCAAAGPQAAGYLDRPDDSIAYTAAGGGVTRCYGGLVLLAPRLAVLGSAELLTNERLDGAGAAALAVNVITADRSVGTVAWLQPGSDAGGNGAQSIRDLFPAWSFRALWWLLAVAVLVALWRARRLGRPVTEPLPVIVRSVEAVEGHGRLYLRAAARDRAAAALRAGAVHRLRPALALPRAATPQQIAAVVAPLIGRAPADVLAVLHGTVPVDDPGLQRLARDLHDLEHAAARAAVTGGEHDR